LEMQRNCSPSPSIRVDAVLCKTRSFHVSLESCCHGYWLWYAAHLCFLHYSDFWYIINDILDGLIEVSRCSRDILYLLPFYTAFLLHRNRSNYTLFIIAISSKESIYIQAQTDRVTVIFQRCSEESRFGIRTCISPGTQCPSIYPSVTSYSCNR
jgi:hypothetical protein